CKDHTANAATERKCNFKGITLGATSYRTYHCKAGLFIIAARRKDYRRSPSRLLPASLRGEVHPNQVAGFGHVFAPYHNSFPTGSPQSVSECWFSGVIPATNSSSVGLRFGFRILTLPG